MKLKDLLKESQHLSYKRMNVGEEEEKGMTNEEKRQFLKAVSEYRKLGEAIYRSGNLSETYESIKGIVETAQKVTLQETGDWFDKVTVNRHMKSMNESFKVFSNTIKEVNTLQQRMESAYDEMGEVLGKYYEIKEAEEKEADMEEGNEFGAARAKAIANGDSEFEVDGKKYKVTSVDDEDKKNAEDFANESKSMKLTSMLNESFGVGNLPSSKLIKMKKSLKEIETEEVVSEGYSTEEKRIVLMAVKKIMKYMNVDMKTAMNYVLGAGQELERDIEKGKVK
jgi:hypothetical protein